MSRLTLVGLALGCMLCACSSDDDKTPSSTGGTGAGVGGSATAGRSSGDSGRGGGGPAGRATQKEGFLCLSNSDCVSGLNCVDFGTIQDASSGETAQIKICARHCTESMPCKEAEQCHAESGDPRDAVCKSKTGEHLKACNLLQECTGTMECILNDFDDDTGEFKGACVQPCMLPGGTCPTDYTCMDVLQNGRMGFCAKTVGRGEVCDLGLECAMGDLCITEATGSTCYQECTMTNTCDDGKKCIALTGSDEKVCDTASP